MWVAAGFWHRLQFSMAAEGSTGLAAIRGVNNEVMCTSCLWLTCPTELVGGSRCMRHARRPPKSDVQRLWSVVVVMVVAVLFDPVFIIVGLLAVLVPVFLRGVMVDGLQRRDGRPRGGTFADQPGRPRGWRVCHRSLSRRPWHPGANEIVGAAQRSGAAQNERCQLVS